MGLLVDHYTGSTSEAASTHAIYATADDQSDRVDLRHDAAADEEDQGLRDPYRHAHDGL